MPPSARTVTRPERPRSRSSQELSSDPAVRLDADQLPARTGQVGVLLDPQVRAVGVAADDAERRSRPRGALVAPGDQRAAPDDVVAPLLAGHASASRRRREPAGLEPGRDRLRHVERRGRGVDERAQICGNGCWADSWSGHARRWGSCTGLRQGTGSAQCAATTVDAMDTTTLFPPAPPRRPTTSDDHRPVRRRPGRFARLWRGPETDPSWARPGLLGLLAATAVLLFWGLTASGWSNAFYSAAVQAGSASWKAFFFGSSDAGELDHRRQAAGLAVGHGAVGARPRPQLVQHPHARGAHGRRLGRGPLRHGQAPVRRSRRAARRWRCSR